MHAASIPTASLSTATANAMGVTGQAIDSGLRLPGLEHPGAAAPEHNRWLAYDTRASWSTFSRPLGQGVSAVGHDVFAEAPQVPTSGSIPGISEAPAARSSRQESSVWESGAWESGSWESVVSIDGMRCAACAIGIEQTLLALPGVDVAEVNATSGKARVVWQAEATRPSHWLEAIYNAGYVPMPAQPDSGAARQAQRVLLWRWLVAGFCMMQVMMYTYPVYVAAPGEISADMLQLLRWASWVLTLPVLLFSSTPFLRNAWQDLRHLRVSMDLPVAIGVLITFGVSSAATWAPKGWWGGEVYFDSLTMFVFFLLTGRWLEARLRDRTAGALDALCRRLPEMASRQTPQGDFVRVAVESLQAGDIVRVLPGETFPGDGIILGGSTSASEALLTGESTPVSKSVGSKVIAGSDNLSASVTVQLQQVGQATRYAGIVALMARAAVDKPRLALLADRIARPFLIFVLMTAFMAAFWLWPADHGQALMTAVAILIVTCPCALSLATPAAVLSAAGALARRGTLLRRLQALETLPRVDTVIFDKTGTLTQDQMQLVRIETQRGIEPDWALLVAASLAAHALHPAARAISAAWGDEPLMPLDGASETHGAGITAWHGMDAWRLGSAAHCGTEARGEQLQVHLANGQGLVARFYLRERLRPDAAETVHALQSSGKRVVLMSGDRQAAVAAVGRSLGIDEVIAECTPDRKLALLKALQRQGHHVMMVGDGLNDGPVLAGASVSVTVGQAVPLAQRQSDIVLPHARLSELRTLFSQSARTMRVVRQNLAWAFVYNAVCIPLAVAGLLPAWLAGLGMATSSLLVVANAARLARIGEKPA